MKGEKFRKIREPVRVAGNGFRVLLDGATGWMRSLRWGASGADLFAQLRRPIEGYIGGICVFDESSRRWYSDFETGAHVKWLRRTARSAVFEKRFRGAPFSVRVEFAAKGSCLDWEVELRQDGGRASIRQVKVVFFLPLIAGWDVWAPAAGVPFTFDGMTSFEFMYNQGPYFGNREVAVPVFCHYSGKLDVGFTVCEHFDRNIPSAKFQFSNGERHFNWSQYFSVPHWEDYPYLETVHSYIGMRGSAPCRTGIRLLFHGGDWRLGMGKVVRLYKRYFFPPTDAAWDRAGVFHCGGVHTVKELDRAIPLGLKYLELHGHFPWYGEYFPEEEEWETVRSLEDRLLGRSGDANLRGGEARLNRERIAEAVRTFKERGVSTHYYINFSDGYRPEVEKRWPECMAMTEAGEPAPSGWHFCHLMNPDPSKPFGRHILRNAADAIAAYPGLDGFFLDCFRHFELDTGADDGVTAVNGKPAYNISFGLARLQEKLSRLLVKRGLDCFANKPRTIQTMRFVDGMLLEGSGEESEAKYFWCCVAKPFYYMWTTKDKPEEEYLKRCVVLGGWPKLPNGKWRTDDREFEFWKKLYGAYLPLYEHFRRRVVCFEKDPVKFSCGLHGQIYVRPDGDYVAGVATDWTSIFDQGGRRVVAPYVAFRLERDERLGDVRIHYAGEPSPRRSDFYRTKNGLLVVDMPDFRTAAVVILRPGSGSRCLGERELRDTHDYCGDPTSAFEFGSGSKE